MSVELQERARTALTELNTLARKGVLADGEAEHFESLTKELDGIKAALDREKATERYNSWAKQTGPMLPMTAGGARTPESVVELSDGTKVGLGFQPHGTAIIEPIKLSERELDRILAKSYGEAVDQYPAEKRAIFGSDEYRQAFKAYARLGERVVHVKGDAYKVLQEGIDTEGGFVVPEDILTRVISKEPTPTRVAGLVTQMPTGRDSVVVPKVNYQTDDIYTTGMRVTWTGEIPASSTASRVTDPVFGQIRIPVYTAMMSLPLTRDLIEDSAFPVVSYASAKFAETIDLLRDNMILNGTGIGQPSGILLNPGGTDQPATVVTGSASDVTADGIIDLTMSLPEQYDDNARAIFSKTTTGAHLAKLKDGEGRYIWSSGTQDSGLATSWKNKLLNGYPSVLSAFMPAPGSNTYPIIFGDLSGYYLVNRVGFSIEVLRELYAETNQVLMLGRVRFGGQVAEPWKLKIQKCST